MPQKLSSEDFDKLLEEFKSKTPTNCYAMFLIIEPDESPEGAKYHQLTNIEPTDLPIVFRDILRHEFERIAKPGVVVKHGG